MRVAIGMHPTSTELVQTLAGIPRRATDLRKVFERIVEDFRRLQDQQLSGRRGWKPLSEAYAARKARELGGREPLVRSGRMIAALRGAGGGYRVRIDQAQLMVGIPEPAIRRGFPLWGVHQLGRKRGPDMPKRRVVVSRAVMRRRWRELLTEHFAAAAAGRS